MTFFEIIYYYTVRLFAKHSEIEAKHTRKNDVIEGDSETRIWHRSLMANRSFMNINRRKSITHE